MRLQRKTGNKMLKILNKYFARRKGPSTVLLKTKLKEETFIYDQEAYRTTEPFFPEFISTLDYKDFIEFYNKHNHEFSKLSWILAYKRSLELLKDENTFDDNKMSNIHPVIESHLFKLIDRLSTKEINILLNIEANHEIHHKDFIDYIEMRNVNIDPDPTTLTYLLEIADKDRELFKKIDMQLKSHFIQENQLNIDSSQHLAKLLDIYCIKLQNIEMTEMIEKRLFEIREQLSLSDAFKVIKIYAHNKIKNPHEGLLEYCFYELAENLDYFNPSIIIKLFEYLSALKCENEHFIIYITKRYLSLCENSEDFSDFDKGNNSAYVLYVLHKLDVS